MLAGNNLGMQISLGVWLGCRSAVSAKQWKRLCVEQACSQQLLYVAVGAGPGGRGVAHVTEHS